MFRGLPKDEKKLLPMQPFATVTVGFYTENQSIPTRVRKFKQRSLATGSTMSLRTHSTNCRATNQLTNSYYSRMGRFLKTRLSIIRTDRRMQRIGSSQRA